METNTPTTPVRYRNDYNLIQANELIRSRQDELTLLEAKIVRLAIAQVLKDDTDLITYTCKVTDLAKFFGLKPSNVYAEMNTLTTGLLTKVIKITTGRHTKTGKCNYIKFHWVDYAKYENGVITLKLSEHLKPYLLGLNELFTMYGITNILGLPTNYAIRLYELLSSFQNLSQDSPYMDSEIQLKKNEIVFSVEYLRDYFNCLGKYKNTNDFLKRIITPSIDSINKKTVLKVDFRKVHTGRKITHIVFNLNTWS